MKETFNYSEIVNRLSEKHKYEERQVLSVFCFSYIQRHVYERLGNLRINCQVIAKDYGLKTTRLDSVYYSLPYEDLRDNLSQLVDEFVEIVIKNLYLKGKFTIFELESPDTCVINMIPYGQVRDIQNEPEHEVIDITELCKVVSTHANSNGFMLYNNELLSVMNSSIRNIFKLVGGCDLSQIGFDLYQTRLYSLISSFENSDQLGLTEYQKAACLIDVYFLYHYKLIEGKVVINNVTFPISLQKCRESKVELSVVKVDDNKWNLHCFIYKV